jgi:hypothetical protein
MGIGVVYSFIGACALAFLTIAHTRAMKMKEQSEEFRRELKWRIEGDDCFAIVGISHPWEHWTCAHRLTEHEMIMTDSCRPAA